MKRILILIFFLAIALQVKSDSMGRNIQPLLNILNGARTECVIYQFYTNSGWTQIKGF